MQARCCRSFFCRTKTKPSTSSRAEIEFRTAFTAGRIMGAGVIAQNARTDSNSGPERHFTLQDVLACRARLGLLQEAPDLRSHEVELGGLEALAAESAHVFRLSF